MYNIENIKGEILEIFAEKQNYDEKYNSLMFDFITKAYELVELSEDLYQVEHTIKLNQISLKDYILNSKICNYLKDNNFNNYSIEDLKEYMQKYENLTNRHLYILRIVRTPGWRVQDNGRKCKVCCRTVS